MAYKLAQKQSPRVNFAISALPQVNQSSPVNYGIFLTGAVSAQSQNSELAWDFWAFATQKNQQKKFSLSSFWPASRKDLIQEQLKDKDLAAFAKQSASAQDWYKGINYAANAELREMVSNYLAGFDAKIVVKNASSKVSSEIQKSRQ
jgi:ABC-type glycerol-3-phosphate transport system substrate-binding protein